MVNNSNRYLDSFSLQLRQYGLSLSLHCIILYCIGFTVVHGGSIIWNSHQNTVTVQLPCDGASRLELAESRCQLQWTRN